MSLWEASATPQTVVRSREASASGPHHKQGGPTGQAALRKTDKPPKLLKTTIGRPIVAQAPAEERQAGASAAKKRKTVRH